MHDAFEGGPGNIKPGAPEKKQADLLTRAILFLLDLALVIFLFVTPFCSSGAYGNFILPEFAFGVMYVIIRIILKVVRQTHITDMCFIALRVVGIIVAVIYYIVLFNFGNYFSWFYPVRKYLYINGNYTDTAYFDFLPEQLPAKTDRYYMSFVPPKEAKAPSINIEFSTDEEGIALMREAALSCGSTLDENSPLMELPDMECYTRRDEDGTCVEYVLDERIGTCGIRWTLNN